MGVLQIMGALIIPHHTIMVDYYGFVLVVDVRFVLGLLILSFLYPATR